MHTLESRDVFCTCTRILIKYGLRAFFLMGISDTLPELFFFFFDKQVLESCTEWSDIRVVTSKSSSTRCSILGPLFFLMYINDVSVDIISTAKLFSNDTSLFSIVHDPNTLANKLNKDLQKISKWAYQWKMSLTHTRTRRLKHLGICLDEELNFNYHIKEKIYKAVQWCY